ncbi:MAG TPA: aminotransferase class V-fold PLP-dependent enzyme [Thermoanaerobaculia bacterium]
MKEHWLLERDIIFLNHGSFGATPIPVLRKQDEFRARLEAEPVRFMVRELEGLLDQGRDVLADFIGADPAGLAFVPNATSGANAVLRSLDLDKHDELLVTDQEYNACRNALDYVAQLAGAKVIVVDVPFPISSSDEVVSRILDRVTDRTRLLLVDHVTSPTALINPVERLVAEMTARGIDTLIDGAHVAGMLPLNVRAIGSAYYTGNLHKWVCAPKGAAFLYVRENRRASVRPLVISHGANSMRTDRSRYHLEFDWPGTFDPTAWLAIPEAIRFLPTLVDGGWPEIMRRNHALALRARDILIGVLGIGKPAPDEMLGSMAAVPLPDGNASEAPSLYGDALQDELLERFKIEVPIAPWPNAPHRVLRVSAQVYNQEHEYEQLARALQELLR